jgi:hypothetical protein
MKTAPKLITLNSENNMKKKYIFILIIAILSACKSTQKLSVPSLPKSSAELLLSNIHKAEPTIENAVVKMNIDINYNGRSFSSAANCKIKRDSAIHISLQPIFGVEMFKMEITPQKILIFDKLNQRYYETDFGFIESKLGEGINFQDFQALVSNCYWSILKTDSINTSCFAEGNTLICQNKTIKQETVTGQDFRIQKVSLQYLISGGKMETQYSDFKLTDNALFPYKISLQASKPGFQVKIDFNCSKISFTTKPVFNTSNINQFTKSDIKQLMTK